MKGGEFMFARFVFCAFYRFKGKLVLCGSTHATPTDAARAYDEVAYKLQGSSANLNFPQDYDMDMPAPATTDEIKKLMSKAPSRKNRGSAGTYPGGPEPPGLSRTMRPKEKKFRKKLAPKVPKKPKERTLLRTGALVYVQIKEKNCFGVLSGRVIRNNRDGTFDVSFDNGHHEDRVDGTRVRKIPKKTKQNGIRGAKTAKVAENANIAKTLRASKTGNTVKAVKTAKRTASEESDDMMLASEVDTVKIPPDVPDGPEFHIDTCSFDLGAAFGDPPTPLAGSAASPAVVCRLLIAHLDPCSLGFTLPACPLSVALELVSPRMQQLQSLLAPGGEPHSTPGPRHAPEGQSTHSARQGPC